MNCDKDCANYKPKPAPWAKPDPISGLTPRFTPKTPLPDGVVLVCKTDLYDWYWTPDGMRIYMAGWTGTGDEWTKEPCKNTCVESSARALGLPLAGSDLAEGEEAWTDERLADGYRRTLAVDYSSALPLAWGSHAAGVRSYLGLDNLRRWKHGWICKRIAKPALKVSRCDEMNQYLAQPAPDIEAQLREAGAKRIASDNASIRDHGTMTAWVRYDGKVDLLVGDLTPARAVAALRAARGKDNDAINLRIKLGLFDQLAAANSKIARLKGEIAEAHGIISDMKEGHDNTYDSHGCHVCAWLTRNGGA